MMDRGDGRQGRPNQAHTTAESHLLDWNWLPQRRSFGVQEGLADS